MKKFSSVVIGTVFLCTACTGLPTPETFPKTTTVAAVLATSVRAFPKMEVTVAANVLCYAVNNISDLPTGAVINIAELFSNDTFTQKEVEIAVILVDLMVICFDGKQIPLEGEGLAYYKYVKEVLLQTCVKLAPKTDITPLHFIS